MNPSKFRFWGTECFDKVTISITLILFCEGPGWIVRNTPFLLELYSLFVLAFLGFYKTKPYHLTMDLLALGMMKNAAKCDT